MKPIRFVRMIAKSSVCAAAIVMLLAPAAQAATATGTFQVLIEIQKSCSVTAGAGSDINLGTVASTASAAGNDTISVTCTKGTPYYIGLAPSVANGGNDSGLGSMASSTGATHGDKVPYQLRSAAGAAGTIWGNTATTSSAGNGVAATGTGAGQSHTVYATVASANYTADSYADTVTVTVNY